MTNNNYEIENALKIIELLKDYTHAGTKPERNEILQKLRGVNRDAYKLITAQNYNPKELITRLKKAIKLDEYKPKNLSIISFAVNEDLDYTHGEFDTFDPKLSHMFKNNANPDTIRERFKQGIQNINLLAKQFSADWIRRFKNHKDLLKLARDSNPDTAQYAYRKLFNALIEDFSKEYGCKIQFDVVKDWNEIPDIFNFNLQKNMNPGAITTGLHIECTGYIINSNMSEKEKNKLREEYEKNLAKNNLDNYKISAVYINIENIRQLYPDPADFFYHALADFTHEMHHALDYQNARHGALGSQIEFLDRNIYVPISESINDNRASATECSSYKIGKTLIKELKKSRLF